MTSPSFGWQFPPGAENDPHAPYNQPPIDQHGEPVVDPDSYEDEQSYEDYEQAMDDAREEAAIRRWEERRQGG